MYLPHVVLRGQNDAEMGTIALCLSLERELDIGYRRDMYLKQN